jgi:hypothetical protein
MAASVAIDLRRDAVVASAFPDATVPEAAKEGAHISGFETPSLHALVCG